MSSAKTLMIKKMVTCFQKLHKENAEGVQSNLFQSKMNELGVPTEAQVNFINQLLSSGKVELLKNEEGKALYKIISTKEIKKLKEMDDKEQIIFRLIKSSGKKGIWLKELKKLSNIASTALMTKIIRSLCRKKIIKSVPSQDGSNRKIYMLYELTPVLRGSTNAFNNGVEIKEELFGVVYETVLAYVNESEEGATVEELTEYLNMNDRMGVELKEADIKAVLKVLYYDAEVQVKTVRNNLVKNATENYYVRRKYTLDKNCSEILKIPCVSCKIAKSCFYGSRITPKNCVYLKEWLIF